MSKVYKSSAFTSDDLFATVSFGGGGSNGCGNDATAKYVPNGIFRADFGPANTIVFH